jgi:ADP-heptose:LPS heptosyltransferase
MRIVALVPGGIGDQILFFPTLDALKQSYPDAEVDVVVEPGAKSAYRLSKVVNDVLTFDYQDRNSPADWANLLGVMRDRCYTAALYAGKGWGVELLLWLTGIPTRIGYTNSAGKIFLTNTIPFKAEQYIAHQYCDLLQGLQIKSPLAIVNGLLFIPQEAGRRLFEVSDSSSLIYRWFCCMGVAIRLSLLSW